MAVFGLVGGAAAQCTLPSELPAGTQFAAGNPWVCVLGERRTHGLSCLPRPAQACPCAALPVSFSVWYG